MVKITSSKRSSSNSSSCLSRICRCGLLRFLVIILLGLLILFQTERDALHKILDEVNTVADQDRFGPNNGDTGDHLAEQVQKRTSFSACLVLQNEHENQYLTEWLAYHYHVLPLRRVLVWLDPLSESSPDDILAKWNDRMNVTLWDHTDQIYPPGHPYHKKHRKHRDNLWDYEQKSDLLSHHDKLMQKNTRQDIFFGACLRRLKREGQSWALLSHTDEYTLINPRVRNESDVLHDKASLIQVPSQNNPQTTETIQLTIPAQNESGSVLKWLHRTQPYAYARPGYILNQPCIPLTQKQFGTQEVADLENRTLPTVFQGTNFSQTYKDFLTLRWHYWGHPDHHVQAPITRQSYVDLGRIPRSLLHWKIDSHRPVPHDDVCPTSRIHETDSLFVVHHYAGTTERVQFGDHAPKGISSALSHPGLHREERLHSDPTHNAFDEGNTIPQWLEGFVADVGVSEAQRLLEGVGHLQ